MEGVDSSQGGSVVGNSGKHIFVLGAGASNPSVHIPLGRDLVWKYHIDCADLLPDINGAPDQSEENIIYSNFSKFVRLAALIYPELAWLPKEWENRGWKAFDLHGELLKKHYVDEMLERLQKQGNKKGAKLVKQLMFEHIAQTSFNSQDISYNNTLYKRFVKEILKNKEPQTTSVISLNFDYMLQDKEFVNEVYFDYLIDFDCIDPNRAQFYRYSNPIPLIKLHGSIDWGICENCGRLHLYFPCMDRMFYKGKVCANKECGGIVSPFIVIPCAEYSEKMDHLWDVARDHLKKADKITVIGYSFPEYDRKVKDLFRESLDSNVHIEVVDKCGYGQEKEETERIRKKYGNLFPDVERSIEVTLDGFCGYLDVQGKHSLK